ncbi:MAG TPA: hypothetical protein VGQ76_14575 [Thermoanaerobaculia bacterium]|nr:hypothetical protein [Thermoanaerobaculia bacterium]
MPGLRVSRVGRGGVLFIVLLTVALSAPAAELLFPEPHHFVRRIDDPISGTVSTVHEYCAGNQVVTIHGDSVSIADYGKQEVIEIDRAAGTYSVTRFEEIARANPYRERKTDDVKVDVKVDASVSLSRSAIEVLIGAAYPNRRSSEHDSILNASRKRGRGIESQASDLHALPVEQTIEHEGLTLRSSIISMTSERVPQDALLIPPGAKLVESRIVRLARELRDLDRLPQ